MTINHSKTTPQQGTTIIELIVVLAAFAAISGIIVSIFISSIGRQRALLREQEITNQAGFAIEYMTRAIAGAATDDTGQCLGNDYKNYDYRVTDLDATTDLYQGILFLSKDGTCYHFYRDANNAIMEEKVGSGAPLKTLLTGNFTIPYMRFILNGDKALIGASGADMSQIQPRVAIALSLGIVKEGGLQEKVFQTTVEKRDFSLSSGAPADGGGGSGGGGGGGGGSGGIGGTP